ncbi:MAG: hypothetical protein C9356_10640 [Oleiphilus sp.]|nr:MAG: hypothetical protein C9356_10640 [Oleiphilus sp.]
MLCERQHSLLICLLAVLLLTVRPADAASQQQPTIAIIIDDMGHNYQTGYELAALPYPITLSFLPGRRFTLALAEFAASQNKEIMLHVPMENTQGIALGIGALKRGMTEADFKESLNQSISAIPYAVGLNNHMGSLLTADNEAMRWVMETLQSNRLYFVDSRTTAKSVAARLASRFGIPNLVRDVFLDHEQSYGYIRSQFRKLLAHAREHGSAIAIAHPHRVTTEFLKEHLPELDQQGFALATASGLWQIKHPVAHMHATTPPASRIAQRRCVPSVTPDTGAVK